MKSSTSGLGLKEIGNNSYAKCFGGWTWRFTDYLEVAERKQTLPLRNSGRVRRSKRCWDWTFNPLPLHTRMKNFPIRFLQIKIQKKYPSQQVFKRKKNRKSCFCLRTFCQLPLRHSKWETLQQRHNWTAVSLMRYTRQRMLSTLVPCVSDCEKIKTIHKIDQHFVGMLQIGKMIMHYLYFSKKWFSAT